MLAACLCLGLSSGLFAFPNPVHISLLPYIHARCSIHLIVIDLNTGLIFDDKYKS